MKENVYGDEVEIDLRELFSLLVSKLWLIILMGGIAAFSCYYIMLQNVVPYYKADTSIYILYRQDENNLLYSDIQTGDSLTSDYQKLIKSRSVLDQVIETLSLDTTYNLLYSKTNVVIETDTRILTITVEDEDPDMAMEIANTIRTVATTYINSVMRIEAVTLLDAAQLPENPIVPNIKKNSAIAAILAGVFVCGILVLANLLSENITKAKEIEERFGLPVLATIPEINEGRLVRQHKKALIRERKTHMKEMLREDREY